MNDFINNRQMIIPKNQEDQNKINDDKYIDYDIKVELSSGDLSKELGDEFGDLDSLKNYNEFSQDEINLSIN